MKGKQWGEIGKERDDYGWSLFHSTRIKEGRNPSEGNSTQPPLIMHKYPGNCRP